MQLCDSTWAAAADRRPAMAAATLLGAARVAVNETQTHWFICNAMKPLAAPRQGRAGQGENWHGGTFRNNL